MVAQSLHYYVVTLPDNWGSQQFSTYLIYLKRMSFVLYLKCRKTLKILFWILVKIWWEWLAIIPTVSIKTNKFIDVDWIVECGVFLAILFSNGADYGLDGVDYFNDQENKVLKLYACTINLHFWWQLHFHYHLSCRLEWQNFNGINVY